MTLTLELTPEAEHKLSHKAAQRGQKLQEYAQSVLLTDAETVVSFTEDTPLAPGESVYDDLKDFIGMFKGGEQTAYSENTSEKFAQELLEKQRQGRL